MKEKSVKYLQRQKENEIMLKLNMFQVECLRNQTDDNVMLISVIKHHVAH